MNEFQNAMVALDMKLTGSKRERVEHMVLNQYRDVGTWLEHGEWYLSDGGYSRLWLTEESLFVTSNSLDRVKTNWSQAQAEIDTVKGLVKLFFKAHGYDWPIR